ncbi:MAG TPA: sugar ABC transporter permease [Solirubrobacteraceae bacterium]|nr:sugar ABC transporter permease [Solirubrobacteraceae bacterium]
MAKLVVGVPQEEARWRFTSRGVPVPRMGRRLPDFLLSFLMVAPALILMLVYVLYPFWQIATGAFETQATLSSPLQWVGLANFRAIFAQGQFTHALVLTIYYTLGQIVLQVSLGLAIALLLNLRLPGRNIARGTILFPFIVPAVVAALIWTYILDPATGPLDYVLVHLHLIQRPLLFLSDPNMAMNTVVLISVWKYMPLIIILFLARLQTIPVEILEAARCDGANAWQTFRHVTWPWVFPVVLIAIMVRTILSFNEFDMPYLLARGGPLNTVFTLPVMIRSLINDQNQLGQASAVSLIMIAILVVVCLAYVWAYRHGERGLDG